MQARYEEVRVALKNRIGVTGLKPDTLIFLINPKLLPIS